MNEPQTETVLDLTGYRCPLPVLKARKALQGMTVGGELTVLCTDAAAPGDFRAFCQAAGHALLSVDHAGEQITIRLRRG